MTTATQTMTFEARSARRMESEPLPENCAVLCIADDAGLIPAPLENHDFCRVLEFADVEEGYGAIVAPHREHARSILEFAGAAWDAGKDRFIACCTAGVGRSVAACGAIAKSQGADYAMAPTYNRQLYRLILEEAGVTLPDEPLVSLAVRVKYRPERLHCFLLSLQAQRYDNWECVAFTDGPNFDAVKLVQQIGDPRIRIIETPHRLGRWGHPYRQMAFEHCRGEWVGTQNDDNYLTPGFIEQLVSAGEDAGADLVACQTLHRYHGWGVDAPGGDLASWLCRRSLLERFRWTGHHFRADTEFLDNLRFGAGRKIAIVNRPLAVKN